MKKIKQNNKSLLIISLAIIVVLGLASVIQIGKAQLEKSKISELTEFANSVGGDQSAFMAGLEYLGDQFGDMLGGGSRFPYGISTDTTEPSAGQVRSTTLTVTATSTFQEIELGSRFSEALTFTAGVTTTPGGLFSIQNTGARKICKNIIVFFAEDASDDTIAATFSAGTSTSASAWSASGGSLIASATVATSSDVTPNSEARVIDQEFAPGSYFGASIGHENATTTSWIWNNGTYVNGAFDFTHFLTASTSAYTSRSGSVYLDCISE